MPEPAPADTESDAHPARKARVPGPIGDEAPPASRLPEERSDDELFRDLMDRFTVLAETCARFSQDVYRWTGARPDVDIDDTIRRNLRIVRTIFGKWSLEILAIIHFDRSASFLQIKKALGRITRPVLSAKLRELERAGLVQRSSATARPTASRYTLTHKGLMITRLGEPVFLYLRVASGWRGHTEREPAEATAGPEPSSPIEP